MLRYTTVQTVALMDPVGVALKGCSGETRLAQHVLIMGWKVQTLPGKQVIHGRHSNPLPHPHAGPHDQQHWQTQASR